MREKILGGRLGRYLLAGALAYAVELSILVSLHRGAGLSAEGATAIAFWFGLSASFVLQKIFAFKDYQKNISALTHQGLTYGLLVAFNYLFTLGVVALFPSKFLVASRTLALVITTAWNFFLYKELIFNPERKPLSFSRLAGWARANRAAFWFGLLASLPVVIFFYQFWSTPHKFIMGDFDYYSQQYEAARISVLHFHQFPWWNPWLSGGVPLFANPQFGLFSIQFLFVLLFGTIYGMKLAYIVYALAGFFGMYALARRVLNASKLRSLLVSYIWIFTSFYAGHSISHFTFASYFLIPWLFYFIARWREKRSWLWLGLSEAVIILSSMHYTFLMSVLVMVVYFVLYFGGQLLGQKKDRYALGKSQVLFALKVFAVVAVLAGYKLLTTYYFVSHNQKSQALLSEPATAPDVLFKALFFPIGTFIKTAPHTVWGWGEYSMYIGIGAGLALATALGTFAASFRKALKGLVSNPLFMGCLVLIALMASAFALGDFGPSSPFHLLHKLPGFAQTRVSARWQVFTMFAILAFLAAWRRTPKLINVLLFLSVLELFITNGPPRIHGQNETPLKLAAFSNTYTMFDNGQKHPDFLYYPKDSYLYSTSANIGQVYADDSLVDTLHGTRHTSHCGINVSPACTFVLSHNAQVDYWSPNKIQLTRTGPGDISLNMNVESGWRINNTYPFATVGDLDPANLFILPANQTHYTLEYAPKFSPSWFKWRLEKI